MNQQNGITYWLLLTPLKPHKCITQLLEVEEASNITSSQGIKRAVIFSSCFFLLHRLFHPFLEYTSLLCPSLSRSSKRKTVYSFFSSRFKENVACVDVLPLDLFLCSEKNWWPLDRSVLYRQLSFVHNRSTKLERFWLLQYTTSDSCIKYGYCRFCVARFAVRHVLFSEWGKLH